MGISGLEFWISHPSQGTVCLSRQDQACLSQLPGDFNNILSNLLKGRWLLRFALSAAMGQDKVLDPHPLTFRLVWHDFHPMIYQQTGRPFCKQWWLYLELFCLYNLMRSQAKEIWPWAMEALEWTDWTSQSKWIFYAIWVGLVHSEYSKISFLSHWVI